MITKPEVKGRVETRYEEKTFYVYCPICGTDGPYDNKFESAVEIFNSHEHKQIKMEVKIVTTEVIVYRKDSL